MPALSRVVDNTVKSDGTILSKVRVTALLPESAEKQAISAALRHNGYSDVLLDSEGGISVEDTEVEYEGRLGLRETFIVDVQIGGAGKFLDSNARS